VKTKIVNRYGSKEVVLQNEYVPNEIGLIALGFATHFGVIAAKTDGEDKAGRAKLELQTVDEIVQRSCDLAQKLTDEMKKRGWFVDLPDQPDEPEEEKKD
jgi:hypothetical protein